MMENGKKVNSRSSKLFLNYFVILLGIGVASSVDGMVNSFFSPVNFRAVTILVLIFSWLHAQFNFGNLDREKLEDKLNIFTRYLEHYAKIGVALFLMIAASRQKHEFLFIQLVTVMYLLDFLFNSLFLSRTKSLGENRNRTAAAFWKTRSLIGAVLFAVLLYLGLQTNILVEFWRAAAGLLVVLVLTTIDEVKNVNYYFRG